DLTDRTKIDEVSLTMTGEIGYTTIRMVRIQNGQTERKTEYHDVRIYGTKIILAQPPHGQDEIQLDPGQYKYQFNIQLPDKLPPSLHETDYPYVKYFLQVLVDKPWYKPDSRQRINFRIFPRVNLLQISNAMSVLRFNSQNRKDIVLHGTLEKASFVPGEIITLNLNIHNQNRITIKHIDVFLIQRYIVETCRRRRILFRVTIPHIENINDEQIKETCCIITPTLNIPPTYEYHSTKTRTPVHVSIHYELKFEVKVKGLFADFDLTIPITCGTDPQPREHETETLTCLTPEPNDRFDTIIDDDEELPPSYESICD
ncbi:unnamed protein product, partial [Didymodactylos carnosus]